MIVTTVTGTPGYHASRSPVGFQAGNEWMRMSGVMSVRCALPTAAVDLPKRDRVQCSVSERGT